MSEVDSASDLAGSISIIQSLQLSGTFGYGEEFDDFTELRRIGRQFCVKGTSAQPIDGNLPRACFLPRQVC